MNPATLLALYSDACIHVRPDPLSTIILSDRDDERVLECAVAARADMIISGDHHLLDLRSFRGIRILRAGELLALMESRLTDL